MKIKSYIKKALLITSLFLISFIVIYLYLLQKDYSLRITDFSKDVITESYEIKNIDLLNNYYKGNADLEDISQFPSNSIELTVNSMPYVHNRDICMNLELNTNDNINLSYNSYDTPLYRSYLNTYKQYTLSDNTYLYTKKTDCKDFISCLEDNEISTFEILGEIDIPDINSYLLNSTELELTKTAQTLKTSLYDMNFIYAYLKKDSYFDFQISSDYGSSNDIETIKITVKNIETGRTGFYEEFENLNNINLKTSLISTFEEGWYSIKIDTEDHTGITGIETNSPYSTLTDFITKTESTFYTSVQNPTKIYIYPTEDIKNNDTILIDSKEYLIDHQITEANPLIIELEKGIHSITTPNISLHTSGIPIAYTKENFAYPYKKILISENFHHSQSADLIITSINQDSSQTTLCFNEYFYSTYNSSKIHDFRIINIDLSYDLNLTQNLIENDFTLHEISKDLNVWSTDKKLPTAEDIEDANSIYTNKTLDNIKYEISEDTKISKSPIYEYSDYKLIFKRAKNDIQINNLSIYRK